MNTQLSDVKIDFSSYRQGLKRVAVVTVAVGAAVCTDIVLASPASIPLATLATAQHADVVKLATALVATMGFGTGAGAVLSATRAIIGRVAGIVRGMFS